MQNDQRFRLTRSAMAIALREERHVAIMIPEGATIEVIGGPFNGTRLMDVRYDGEMILMFTDDMKTHTELIKAATAWFRAEHHQERFADKDQLIPAL